MLHSGQFELPPRKKLNRRRASLRLEFGALFLCTIGLAYLSYWLFAEYREEKKMEWASTPTSLSPRKTELELSSQSISQRNTPFDEPIVTGLADTTTSRLEAAIQAVKMPLILFDGEIHIGTDGIFTTTNLPDEWYEQRVFRPLPGARPPSRNGEDTASLKINDEPSLQTGGIATLGSPVTLERVALPMIGAGGELYDVEATPLTRRPNSVINYDPYSLSGGKMVIGSQAAADREQKTSDNDYHSNFNSATGGKAPIGGGKSLVEGDRSILKNAFQTPEELSEPVFTLRSESAGHFSAAPSDSTFLPSSIPPAVETSEFSRLSIFKDPNYDEELLNQFRNRGGRPEIPVSEPLSKKKAPPPFHNSSLKPGAARNSLPGPVSPSGGSLPVAKPTLPNARGALATAASPFLLQGTSSPVPTTTPPTTANPIASTNGVAPRPGVRPIIPKAGNATPGNPTTGTPTPGVNPPANPNGINNPSTPGNPTPGTPNPGVNPPATPNGINNPSTTAPPTLPPASGVGQTPPLNPTPPVTGIGGGIPTPVIPLPPVAGGATGVGGITPFPVNPPTTPVTPSIGGGGGSATPPTPPTIPITPIPPLNGVVGTAPPTPSLPPVSTGGGTTPPTTSIPPATGGGTIPPFTPGTTLPPTSPPSPVIGGGSGITTPVIPLPPVAGGGGAIGGNIPIPVIPPLVPIIPSIGGGGGSGGGGSTPPSVPITPIPPLNGGGGTTPSTPSLPPVTGGGGIPPYNPGGTNPPVTPVPTPGGGGGAIPLIPIPPVVPIGGGAGGGGTIAPVVPPITAPVNPPTTPGIPPGPDPEKNPRLKNLICTPWTVQSGQTIESLARSTGASPIDIREINAITTIRPGQTIRLPIQLPIPCCD